MSRFFQLFRFDILLINKVIKKNKSPDVHMEDISRDDNCET